MTAQTTEVPTRSWILWLLIGLVTFGIGYIIYIFFNFSDMEKLATKKGVVTTSPVIGLLAYIIFSPIGIWLKYSDLNKIAEASGGTETAPNPLLVIILGFLTLGLYALYAEYKWQSVMNYYAMQ